MATASPTWPWQCGSNSVSVLLGKGGRHLPRSRQLRRPARRLLSHCVAVGDFNGDGIPTSLWPTTVTTTVRGLSVLLGNGDGTFQAAVNYGAGGGSGGFPSSVGVGDFNGDGVPDLAVATGAVSACC